NNARVLSDSPGLRLVGVSDPDPNHGQLVAGMVGCPWVPDIHALMDLGIDAVTIAAPTHLHHDLALAAIRRGVHVLVEKPIASTVAEGIAIAEEAQPYGVALMVGHF